MHSSRSYIKSYFWIICISALLHLSGIYYFLIEPPASANKTLKNRIEVTYTPPPAKPPVPDIQETLDQTEPEPIDPLDRPELDPTLTIQEYQAGDVETSTNNSDREQIEIDVGVKQATAIKKEGGPSAQPRKPV